jgi:hypothetical protein
VILAVLYDPPSPASSIEKKQMFALHRMACASWKRIDPNTKIHIWMDTFDGCNRAAEYPEFINVQCKPMPEMSVEHEQPFLHSIWVDARAEYPEHILVWINSDTIATPEILWRLNAVFSELPEATVIARRTDFNASEFPSNTNDVTADPSRLIDSATKNVTLQDDTGIDLFALHANSALIGNLPPFVVGAYRWDNWLVFWCLRENIPVVDVSKHGIMLHVVKPSNNVHHALRRGAEYNDILCKSLVGELFRMGTVSNADYVLSSNGQGWKVLKNENQSIAVTLARRAGKSRWIVVVTVSEGYLDFACQWLCNIKRIGLGSYVFLAQDEESKRRLMAANEAVIEARSFILSSDLKDLNLTQHLSAEAEYGTVGFQVTMTLRTIVLKKILSFGLNVITADLDSIWIQDPLPMLHRNATVQGQEHKKTKMSGGFVAIRSVYAGRYYWNKVLECQVKNMQFLATAMPGTYSPSKFTEQECVNDEALKLIQKNTSEFAVHILPATYFPDGLSFFTNFDSARQGVLPYVIHNNWLVGMKAKRERLRQLGLYFNRSVLDKCPFHPLTPNYELFPTSKNKARVMLHWNQSQEHAHGYRYRIHILTMCRPKSLKRLLSSLQAANYTGHQVAIVFLVDMPKPDAVDQIRRLWVETLEICRAFKLAPGVAHVVIEHAHNHGLISQWIDPWPASDSNEIMIILEDDLEVSPSWFSHVVSTTERYYRKSEAAGGDASLAGFSLQRQHTILGERPDLRYGQATPGSILNRHHLFYRYQLPSTWGSVWFPHAWSSFLGWVQSIELNKTVGTSAKVKPCIPALISNSWWEQEPSSVWSVWIVRFVFERGLYFLYINLPDNAAMVVNHREAGIHFGGIKGPDAHLKHDVNLQVLPNLASIPLFDLHFRRVQSAESLRWNSLVLSPQGLDRCALFNTSLVAKHNPVFSSTVTDLPSKKVKPSLFVPLSDRNLVSKAKRRSRRKTKHKIAGK